MKLKRYYVNNKADAIKIMSMKSGIGENEIMNGLNSVALPSLKENINIALNISINETTSLYSSGKEVTEFYTNRGQISQYPDLNQIIDSTFANDVWDNQKIDMLQANAVRLEKSVKNEILR